MSVAHVVIGLWATFVLSWIAAMFWSNTTEKQLGIGKEWLYRVVLIVGGVIFFIPAHGYNGPLRLWYLPYSAVWPSVALIAAGFAFSWWARISLGSLWSGQITKKEGHHVVDTGPYGIVRHPIYTGILLAVYATAALKGTVPGVVGSVIITLGLWMKAWLEEGWLSQELGAEAYDDYSSRVSMLIPFGPKRG